jgi:hypothetical protein
MSRPLKFESVEDLAERINEYFYSCDTRLKTVFTKEGELIEVPDPKPYTISGLAYFLGTSRQTLLNYEDRDEYFDTIKNAKARIEMYVEESLWTPKIASGVIFNLKNNFGWVDKSELDQSSKVDATITVKMDGELEEWSK